MDLAALIAFIGLIAGQFTAVIAVHALRPDDEAARAAGRQFRPDRTTPASIGPYVRPEHEPC
jgi:hypothetical protein